MKYTYSFKYNMKTSGANLSNFQRHLSKLKYIFSYWKLRTKGSCSGNFMSIYEIKY